MSLGDSAKTWLTVPLIINGKDIISEISFPIYSPSNSEKPWSGLSTLINNVIRAIEGA